MYRTVNLKEVVDSNPDFVGTKVSGNVEISIPIFLRPIMIEILSIGKSIKIVRYLERIRTNKE